MEQATTLNPRKMIMTDDDLDIQVYNLKSLFAINQQSLHNIQKISTEVGDIFYVDNLYKDVEKVKEFALGLPYTNNSYLVGAAPVFRSFTSPCKYAQYIIGNMISEIFDEEIYDNLLMFSFSYQTKKMCENLIYNPPHRDSKLTNFNRDYAAVIYLNDQSGTSFFKNHNDDNDMNLGTLLNHPEHHSNFYHESSMDDYEEVAYIEGKQNRLTIYDSFILHRPDYARNDKIRDFRLVQNLHYKKHQTNVEL